MTSQTIFKTEEEQAASDRRERLIEAVISALENVVVITLSVVVGYWMAYAEFAAWAEVGHLLSSIQSAK